MAALQTDVNHLLHQARTRLTGSSDAGIKADLFDVFNDFFNLSSVWTEDIEIPVVPDITEYVVVPKDGGQVIRLAGVIDSNLFSQPAIMPEFGTVLFASAYNSAQTMTATVVKNVQRPVQKDNLPEVPEWTLAIFGVTILDGVLGRMMMQPGKPYFNEQAGVYHMKKFNDGTAGARVSKLRRNAFGTQAWRYPRFAGGSQRGGVSVGVDTRF